MKKLIALLLTVAMVLSLAACVSNGTNDNTTTEGNNGGTTTTGGSDEITYKEAPYITNLGTFGKVEDRLPVAEDIMVEDADYLKVGVYGGELKTSSSSSSWTTGKIIEEGLFRFKIDGTLEPNVAKGYEVNSEYTKYTIYLREGMKWSDGKPFTAEDCVWFFNVICKNKIDDKGVRSCHKDSEGNPAVVEKVNDTTFTVTFGTPKYDFIEALAVDLKWHYAPKHIFEKYAQLVIDGKTDEALAEAEKICGKKFENTKKAGKEMLYYFWNYPGIPTLNPFVLSTEAGKNDIKGDYYEYIRNPYYWKTDSVGNQLPYIDKITYTKISNTDQSLLLLLDGTVDFQTVAMADLKTITESKTKINIYEWNSASWGDTGTQLHLNLGIADAKLNALFNNAAFREALSICVDREEFASLYSGGWLKGGQAAPSKGALGYTEEWATKWTKYDVERAKTLFEQAGLKKGTDGFYDFADGTDFKLNIVSQTENGAADTYKLLKKYFDAVGIETTFRDYDRDYINTELAAGSIECMLYPVTGIGDVSIILKPASMVPNAASANVAWYGRLNEKTVTGDLLELVKLKQKLDKTGDAAERVKIAEQMLKLHEKNQWTIAYVEAAPVYHAVNNRIQNFRAEGVASDIYRDMGFGHCQNWFIPADQQ